MTFSVDTTRRGTPLSSSDTAIDTRMMPAIRWSKLLALRDSVRSRCPDTYIVTPVTAANATAASESIERSVRSPADEPNDTRIAKLVPPTVSGNVVGMNCSR